MNKQQLGEKFEEAKRNGDTEKMDEYNRRWCGLFMDFKESEEKNEHIRNKSNEGT